MLLKIIFFIPIFSILTLFLASETNRRFIQNVTAIASGLALLLSLALIIAFKSIKSSFQTWVIYKFDLSFLNFQFSFGLDGTAILFITLSSFLIFLCVLFINKEQNYYKEYNIVLLTILTLLLFVFCTQNVFFFYVFFEAILIPMFLMIGVWGSRERKIRASYLFFFFTLVGSLFLLIGLIYIYLTVGTLSYEYIKNYPFSETEQFWLWLSFFFSLATKIPLFPFHIWLPEAHVEAPTVGSVLLAGILLKLGVYGFLKFNLYLFPQASFYFFPLVHLLGICGILFGSLSALRQIDFKRIIAYSSIAHMNLVAIGIFSFNILGIEGAILQSLSHGFISGALFFLIGILYNTYHTRLLSVYSGLNHVMPIYSTFFLCFTLGNIAMPGTSSFVGEFLILLGLSKISIISCFFASLGVILCGTYSLWTYNRICFGNLKITGLNILFHEYKDINVIDFTILMPLLILVLITGIYPNFILETIHFCSDSYIQITV